MIYIVSDIHGHIRIEQLKEKLLTIDLDKNDLLIITGDAGICWDSKENEGVIKYYNSLECNTLFIDGNHENFDILNALPIEQKYGGKVHKISDKIYHLIRGESFNLNGYKCFAFGGGFSAKRLNHTSPIYIWDEELPSEDEYKRGLETLKKNNYNFDLILTHSGPLSIVEKNNFPKHQNEEKLLAYLEFIKSNCEFNHWYFGHYHIDRDIDKFSCIFDRLICLEDKND